jgi:hypothetical protein
MPNIICGCGKNVETKPEWAGQWIACPGCGGTLYAPFPGEKTGPPVPVIEITPSTPAAEQTRLCPWCSETIPVSAAQCPHCKSNMGQSAARPAPLVPAANTAPAGPLPDDTGGFAPLIVGILGLILCQFLSPVAWAMGSTYEKKCRARGVSPSTAGTGGKILGICGTVLLFLVLAFFMFAAVRS